MATYAALGGEENNVNVSVNVASDKTLNTFKIDSEADTAEVHLLDESQQTKELTCFAKLVRFLSSHLKSIVFGGLSGLCFFLAVRAPSFHTECCFQSSRD